MFVNFSVSIQLLLLIPAVLLAVPPELTTLAPENVIQVLQDGNTRFVAGESVGWQNAAGHRSELSSGQHPIACIVTCSDSRVSPEIVLDQSLGDLFVCRIAGSVITPEIAGSVEYAVEHLNVPVVIVLGHSECGAVQAALSPHGVTGPLASLVMRLKPAIDVCRLRGVDDEHLWSEAVSTSANLGCASLYESCPTLQRAVSDGRCIIASATYDLSTGLVEWETQLTNLNALMPDDQRQTTSHGNTNSGYEGSSNTFQRPDTESVTETPTTSASRTTTKQPEKRTVTRPRRY